VARQRWAIEGIYSFVTRQRAALPSGYQKALLSLD
jgi:hypothetical protein